MNQQQSIEGQNPGENSGLGDWSFDNLDEIVAVAIKAEFHTMDLAELGKWGHSVEKQEIHSHKKIFHEINSI